MIDFIGEIIKRFGPRLAGGEAERNAQLFVKAALEKFSHEVELQTFEAALTAKFHKMKIYAVLYWLSVAVFFFNPFAAFFFAFINAAITVNDLMRNGTWLDFLYPKLQSCNITTAVEPQNEAKQTIVFTGHIDSTEECQWWYWLKQWGGYLTFACGILIVAYAAFCFFEVGARIIFNHSILSPINWLFVLLSPIQLVYFSFHSKRVVDGASDNLSGTAISFFLLKHFKENPLKHTRIRFISFGAEEKGLRGSKAYVKQNLEQLKRENSLVVNIDTIRLVKDISIVNKETMIGVNHNEQLAIEVKESFDSLQLPIRVNPLPMGGTDAVPFSMAGIPAISVIGLDTKTLDPTYHTRLDTLEMIEPQSLQNVKDALIDFVLKTDKKL